MKSTSSILKEFEKTAEIWKTSLDVYTETHFAQKPSADEWSIGQVYNHLVSGTNRFHLAHIRQCLNGAESTPEGKTLPGKLIYLLGSFLPVRIKVPASDTYTPKQPSNIDEMRKGLIDLITTMRATEAKLQGASEAGKTAHPRLGFLNAREWFALIEMHFRHHLRQKERLDQFLKQAA